MIITVTVLAVNVGAMYLYYYVPFNQVMRSYSIRPPLTAKCFDLLKLNVFFLDMSGYDDLNESLRNRPTNPIRSDK